jgi:hypothetical protein
MEKLLIISQKYPEADLSYRQDESLIDTINKLQTNFDVEYLYIHKSFDDGEKEPYKFNVKTHNFFDLIENLTAPKALSAFITENGFKNIFFTSIFIAKAILPLIDTVLDSVNIIVDMRLSSALCSLKMLENTYEEESEIKKQVKYKEIRGAVIREISILRLADWLIMETESEITFMKKYVPSKNFALYDNLSSQTTFGLKTDHTAQNVKALKIVIDTFNVLSDNSASGETYEKEILGKNITFNTVKVFSKNVIKNINEAVKKSKEDYIVLCYDKILLYNKAASVMFEALALNNYMAAAIPVVNIPDFGFNSKEMNVNKHAFSSFGNWFEPNFLNFNCAVLNRKVMLKIGLFDERLATLDYAFFDFAMRAYQAGYFVININDALVYKTSVLAPDLAKNKEDKIIASLKWNDYNLYNISI